MIYLRLQTGTENLFRRKYWWRISHSRRVNSLILRLSRPERDLRGLNLQRLKNIEKLIRISNLNFYWKISPLRAYRTSPIRRALCIFLYIVTGGIAFLFLHWYRDWWLQLNAKQVPFSQSNIWLKVLNIIVY